MPIDSLEQQILQHPEFLNFRYISYETPAKPSLSPLNTYYIHTILRTFEAFIHHVLAASEIHGWQSYGEYHKKHIGSSHEEAPSYLCFTKNAEPMVGYILIKSNTHITPEHGKMWKAGTTKNIKLSALLIKCSIVHSITPQIYEFELQSLSRVVTFTRPAQTKRLDPALMASAGSAQERSKLKSIAMKDLLASHLSEFNGWVILSFQDPSSPTFERILAYQDYTGLNLREIIHRLQLTKPLERILFILSLLQEVEKIISQERIWPIDIKFSNLCLYDPKKYKLRFIDYKGHSFTFTFLKSPFREQHGGYTHPSFKAHNTTGYYTQIKSDIDARKPYRPDAHDWSRSYRFKTVTYHLCFELVLIIFQICYLDRVFAKDLSHFLVLFSHGTPFPIEEELETSLISMMTVCANADTLPPNEQKAALKALPFYNTLSMYTYHQNRLASFASDASVSMILEHFFQSIRIDLFNYMAINKSAIKLFDKPESPATEWGPVICAVRSGIEAHDASYPLSTLWIQKISLEFQNIPNTPPQDLAPTHFILQPV